MTEDAKTAQIGPLSLAPLLPDFLRSPIQGSLRLQAEYGDLVRLKFGNRRSLLIVSDPLAARHILQENHANYVKQSYYHRYVFHHILGQGLLMSEGAEWQRTRRLMQPSFRADRLDALHGEIRAVVGQELDKWEKASRQRKNFGLFGAMETLARKVNNHLIVGTDSFGSQIRDLRVDFSRYGPFILATKGKWLRFPGFDYPQSASALREAVLDIIRQRQAGGEQKYDFLNFLLSARDRRSGESLNEAQLLDEVMTLIFAGSETTEKPLAWIWYLLSQNPGWMESIYQCVDHESFFHPDASASEQCAVTAALHETMRLYPPAWILGRRALKDDVIGSGPVSGGDTVVINIYAIHHHPEHWHEPRRFDPQRFLTPKSARTDGLVYLPFGAGPRKCLGDHLAMLEMRFIVGMIARRFRLEMLAGQHVSARPNISLSPKKEIFFRLIPRRSF